MKPSPPVARLVIPALVAALAFAGGYLLGGHHAGAGDPNAAQHPDHASAAPGQSTGSGPGDPNQLGAAGKGAGTRVGGGGDRPLGLNAAQIMSDLIRLVEAEERIPNRSEAVEARIQLLVESGAEGRQALAAFLKENADYSIGGYEQIASHWDSLRHKVVETLSRNQSPESEEALRYMIESSPYLREALKSAKTLEDWKVPLGDSLNTQLRELTRQELTRLATAEKDKFTDADLMACARAALKYGEGDLLPEVEKLFATKYTETKDSMYGLVLMQMSGPQLQASLERVGVESPLAQSVTNNQTALLLTDFRQPAMQDLLIGLGRGKRMETSKLQSILTSEMWMNNVKGDVSEGNGLGWSNQSQINSKSDRDSLLQKLDGYSRVLNTLQDAPEADPGIRAVCRLQLEVVANRRREVLAKTFE